VDEAAPRRAAAPLGVLAAVSVLAAAGVVVAGAGGHHDLIGDPGLRVTSPADGALVGQGFALRWDVGSHPGSFAVLVDGVPPRPGHVVEPGASTVISPYAQLRVTLGARTGGSPDADRAHEITIVPVDSHDRRIGEDVAVVHVRTR
jgi:hypothetical protein